MKFGARFPANLTFFNLNILAASAKLALLLIICAAPTFNIRAQQKSAEIDHLTIAEDDLIHDTQELDKRIEIYVKAIDRRFVVISGGTETKTAVKETKKKDKDADKWGPPPTGTRAELLSDVKSILDEAVRNIDNAAEHNAKNALLPRALKKLADGCSRFSTQLKPFYDSAQGEKTRADVYDALENCREVIAASTEHGADVTK